MGALTEAIKDDHQEMYEYAEKVAKAKGDPDTQQKYGNQLIWETSRHMISEELFVYPLMERSFPNAKELTDHDREQHQQVKELMFKLERMAAKDDETAYTKLVDDIHRHLKEHNGEEEEHDLPPLEKRLTEQESKDAAASFERFKKFAPTRPHPSAPGDSSYSEGIASLLLAPIDKIRDAFTAFPS